MALIKIKNQRNEEKIEISHYYFESAVSHCLSVILSDSINYPLKLGGIIALDNAKEHMNYLDTKRYSGFYVKKDGSKVKDQSFNAVIFNTLIHYNVEYAIIPYLYNEVQRDVPIIVRLKHVLKVIEFFRKHLGSDRLEGLENDFNNMIENAEEDDVFYVYLDEYQLNYEIKEVHLSILNKDKNFKRKLKELFLESEYETLECFIEEIEDLDVELSPEDEKMVIANKCNHLEDSDIEGYYFEGDYNAFTILQKMDHSR